MASNFRILVHQDGDSLHLTLGGDFDGSSACQLLETVKENAAGVQRVFICTRSLKTIYPFGLNVFEKKLLELKLTSLQVLFTGEHAKTIAPVQSMSF